MFKLLPHRLTLARLSALAFAGVFVSRAEATDLSNNLVNITSGVESASGNRWVAAQFKTDASTHVLSSATLLLANTAVGSAQLSLYSDAGVEPGALIASFTSPGSYSAGVASNTFMSTGVNLAAATNYWLVLRATSGSFDWGWTADNSGSGAGFLHVWGVSDDAGAFWWSHDIYQTQFQLSVDVACEGDTNGSHVVNIDDLVTVITSWGSCPAPCPNYCAADVDHNCLVNIDDLVSVITHWGACP